MESSLFYVNQATLELDKAENGNIKNSEYRVAAAAVWVQLAGIAAAKEIAQETREWVNADG